ncbi:hypothetical protein Tco_0854435 [Tanacetum coccineum]
MDQDLVIRWLASKVPMLKLVSLTLEDEMNPSLLQALKKRKQREIDLKARSTLLMGNPNEHQLKLTPSKMPKSWLQAIEKGLEGILAT